VGILLLVVAAYVADKYDKPFHVAAACVIIETMFLLIDGGSFGEILLSAVTLGVFCLAYFITLIKVSDNLAMWLIVLMSFPLALFLVPIVL
jgi:hypothetical protein